MFHYASENQKVVTGFRTSNRENRAYSARDAKKLGRRANAGRGRIRTGQVLNSPFMQSPEQAAGRAADFEYASVAGWDKSHGDVRDIMKSRFHHGWSRGARTAAVVLRQLGVVAIENGLLRNSIGEARAAIPADDDVISVEQARPGELLEPLPIEEGRAAPAANRTRPRSLPFERKLLDYRRANHHACSPLCLFAAPRGMGSRDAAEWRNKPGPTSRGRAGGDGSGSRCFGNV